jgi:hypothetical protein
MKPEDVIKDTRFLKYIKVDPVTGCWNWTGAVTCNGYGNYRVGGKYGRQLRPHRYAYEIVIGSIIPGMYIHHRCENKLCVNPVHLSMVTAQDNTLNNCNPAALNSIKTHCKNGHPFDDKNTLIRPDGRRRCRTCEAEGARRRRRA